MIDRAFKAIQARYKVKSKDLAEKTKISEKQISQFRAGKKNLGYKSLWQLIVALGEIQLRARIDLALFISGCSSLDGKIYWQKLFKNFSERELSVILQIIAKEIKEQ